ncbi:terpene synthase family protein [Nocardia terpenica]|uniref:Terpene synthase n=1 Tax=Nocardia terpenica TaxID=455432 RepID=A0A6G9ZEP5_9NOCA|nr:hypothetical protein [Nocardia terpenica]QIS23576.1 hypothetical protein F6W96_40205 [Nocardia terpenica]
MPELNTAGMGWISQFGPFRDDTHRQRYADSFGAELPARILPDAPFGPALQVVANLFFWLWVFDDLLCDEVPPGQAANDQVVLLTKLARSAEIPSGPAVGSPYWPVASLGSLRHDLDQVASPRQVARWVAATHMYLLSNAAIAAYNTQGVIPDIDSYIALRIHSGAVKMTLMLVDVAHGYELPAEDMERPEIWALNEMVCAIVGCDNDLLTYYKEVTRGGANHNLITVLRAAGMSSAEAVHHTIAMRDRVFALFLRLRDQVAVGCGPGMRRYLDCLSNWIRAHLDWGLATARYHNPHDPKHLPHDYARTSHDASLKPLPIPTIAWWWDLLTP